MNKITAKYSCLPEVNFTKFYSVNVTGGVIKALPILSTPMNHDIRSLPGAVIVGRRTAGCGITNGGMADRVIRNG